jgi:hypothetical protein
VEKTLLELKWKHASQFKKSQKVIWRVDPSDYEVAGFVHNSFNLYQVIVRSAGHMVPAGTLPFLVEIFRILILSSSLLDQPRSARDMMIRYIYDIPFGG